MKLSSISCWLLLALLPLTLSAQSVVLKGHVTDAQGNALPGASILVLGHNPPGPPQVVGRTTSGPAGGFDLRFDSKGAFDLQVDVEGFRSVVRRVTVGFEKNPEIVISMGELSTRVESVTVTADINQTDIVSPDPGEKVFVRQDLL